MKRINRKSPNPGILLAIEKVGSQVKLAELLGCTQPNVVYWLYSKVPAERAQQIERMTGVPRYCIRPDLFSKNDRA